MTFPMTLKRLATETITLSRTPNAVGAIIGDPVEISSNLKAIPPMPYVSSIGHEDHVQIPFEMWETFVYGDADIREGDFATINSVEFEVAQVADWPWPFKSESGYKHVILKERKQSG